MRFEQPPATTPKPPLLWLQTVLFSTTLFIALTAVPWYGYQQGYSWPLILAAGVFLWANGLSITAGYHRLWSHKTYQAHPALRLLFALFGAAALQNSALVWCSDHRRHHRHVDSDERDPYSAGKGLWFSHIGWMLRDYDSAKEDFSNAKDLQRDPLVVWQHKHYLAIAISMNIAPVVLIGWLCGDMLGSLLLAGVLRLVISHHSTFLINSLAHVWGRRPYTDNNSARDNDLLAFFTYGEGYHNFHHQFQTDYRNGVRWWQFDPTKWLINTASRIGLARNLTRIPDFKIHRALIAMQFKQAEQKLADKNAHDWAEPLRACLDKEYQQFTASLAEWKELRQQWFQQKRANFNGATHELSKELHRKWEQTALHSRFQELDYALKMQRKRLNYLTLQMA